MVSGLLNLFTNAQFWNLLELRSILAHWMETRFLWQNVATEFDRSECTYGKKTKINVEKKERPNIWRKKGRRNAMKMKAENEIWSLSAYWNVGNMMVKSSVQVRRKTEIWDGMNGVIIEEAYRLLLLYANGLREDVILLSPQHNFVGRRNFSAMTRNTCDYSFTISAHRYEGSEYTAISMLGIV
jgi:hypothetical protein